MSDDKPESGVLQDNRRGAILSDDRQYRYRLWREWDTEKPTLAWIMLNPSTADETQDDPTLRRCWGFAEEWGYGKIVLGNLFALRSSEPQDLHDHPSPVGPENNRHLREIAKDTDQVVGAWGAHGELEGRGTEVARMLDVDLYALGTTKEGQPVHPLYQPTDVELVRWTP